jgi:sulfite exporter TauE/SafE
MFHQMTLAALVFHAQENLQLSAPSYGVLLTAAAFGGILGGLIAESVIKRLGAIKSAQWMLALSLVDFAVLALVPSIAGVAFALFIGGMSGIVWDTVSVSNRQRLIPDEMLGRVNSMYRLLAWGMMPVGLLFGGVLIRLADGPLERGLAIMTPFAAATIGLAILLAFQWKAIARGLEQMGAGR